MEEKGYVLKIIRIGECKHCGFCCGFVDGKITDGSCRHLQPDGTCGIYDKRDQYCPECGHDHKNCVTTPKYPLNKINPKCGYIFIEEETGAVVINIELG